MSITAAIDQLADAFDLTPDQVVTAVLRARTRSGTPARRRAKSSNMSKEELDALEAVVHWPRSTSSELSILLGTDSTRALSKLHARGYVTRNDLGTRAGGGIRYTDYEATTAGRNALNSTQKGQS